MNVEKPIVKRQRRGRELIRNGRGYSKGELKQAGFDNINLARIHGIQVDVLRKTCHPENVEQLKSIAKKPRQKQNQRNVVQERSKKETKQQ
jgi:ribosomal protein L13E